MDGIERALVVEFHDIRVIEQHYCYVVSLIYVTLRTARASHAMRIHKRFYLYLVTGCDR